MGRMMCSVWQGTEQGHRSAVCVCMYVVLNCEMWLVGGDVCVLFLSASILALSLTTFTPD